MPFSLVQAKYIELFGFVPTDSVNKLAGVVYPKVGHFTFTPPIPQKEIIIFFFERHPPLARPVCPHAGGTVTP